MELVLMRVGERRKTADCPMIFSCEIPKVIVRYAQININSGAGTGFLRGGGECLYLGSYRVLNFISALIFTIPFNFVRLS